MRSFDLITKTASEPARSWTNKEKALFHYFNPNGLYAKKKAMDDLISKAVDEGRAKSGAILAYGSLSYYNIDRLFEFTTKKYVDRIDLNTTLGMLSDDIAAASNFLKTV